MRKKSVPPPGHFPQKYLFDYLSIENLDPYDAPQFMVEEWLEEVEHELAGQDVFADSFNKEDVKRFTEWLVENHKGEYLVEHDPYDAPAYLTLTWPKILPAKTWLIHFTDEDPFDAFDRGTTVEGMALSTWKRVKVKGDCKRNLSDDLGLVEYVYGFAMTAYWKGFHLDSYSRKYGKNAVLFQCDVAVEATHFGDEEDQAIFPICSEYNVVPLWGVREGLRIRFQDSDDDGLEFDTPRDLIDYIEKEEAGGSRPLERIV